MTDIIELAKQAGFDVSEGLIIVGDYGNQWDVSEKLTKFAQLLQQGEAMAIPESDATKRVTLEKTKHILETTPYKVCGYVLNFGDGYCLSYKQAVRWTDTDELFNFTHQITSPDTQQKLDKAREALQFYSDCKFFMTHPDGKVELIDHGCKAELALKDIK